MYTFCSFYQEIKKALKIGDRLIVAISENSNKNYLFNSEERVSLVRKSLFTDLKMSQSKIKIISFNCLTTALCKKMKANIQNSGWSQP